MENTQTNTELKIDKFLGSALTLGAQKYWYHEILWDFGRVKHEDSGVGVELVKETAAGRGKEKIKKEGGCALRMDPYCAKSLNAIM